MSILEFPPLRLGNMISPMRADDDILGEMLNNNNYMIFMSNYIKSLQDDVANAKNGLADIQERITELKVYLTSSKFNEDPTVQTSDVLRRLENIKRGVDLTQNHIGEPISTS